jgi:hypothetical protein
LPLDPTSIVACGSDCRVCACFQGQLKMAHQPLFFAWVPRIVCNEGTSHCTHNRVPMVFSCSTATGAIYVT